MGCSARNLASKIAKYIINVIPCIVNKGDDIMQTKAINPKALKGYLLFQIQHWSTDADTAKRHEQRINAYQELIDKINNNGFAEYESAHLQWFDEFNK